MQNNLFQAQQQQANSNDAIVNEKRRSKSRSKVWEKVGWFTRKAKGVKDGKNGSDAFRISSEFGGGNAAVNVDCVCGENNKSKQKVRKARSFKYLKRRKVRQFGDELSSVTVVEKADLKDCGTATGTFHDFHSERRTSRQERERTLSSNSLLSEMARGMNSSPRKVKANVKSVLSLPIDDLSLNEGPGGDCLSASPTFSQVRRSVSFSGSTCNSWPRKKRTHLDNVSRNDLTSPPSKQKRLSRIKKRATFSGFDSSRVNLKTSFFSLCKEVKSTPHLPAPQVSQIRNQNGLTIGVIHFYKSPSVYQKAEVSLKRMSETRQAELTDAEFAGLDIPQISLPLDQEKEETVFPKEFDADAHESSVCVHEKDGTGGIHDNSMLQEHSCHSNSACDSPSGNGDDEDNAKGCFSFNIKSSDGQNSTISAFLLEGQCSSSFTAASSDPYADLAKEKAALISCSSKLNEKGSISSLHENSFASNICCPGSNILHKSVHITESGCLPDEPMEIPEYYTKVSDFQPYEGTLNLKHISPDNSSLTITPRVPSSNKISDSLSSTLHDEQKPVACSLPSVDKDRNIDVTLDCSGVSSETQTSLDRGKNLWKTKPAVNGMQFKKNSEDILQWFREFNDEQKNVLIRRLLEECELPQMHMLSVAMEPILHKSCPPNCQDMLAWLPHHVALHVLSFLDSVSLCRCSQVNRTWNNLASNPSLWQNLCGQPDWQLSRIGEEKEKKKYTLGDGTVQWKKMFASRFLLHQNWLKGKCNVRTFEGHTQGISCVQFDDTRIASGSYDKTIRVWDITSDESDVVLTLSGHSGTVRCLNLNGNRLVSGSVDRSIKVWDLSFKSYWSGASCKVTMIGHMHTVRCLQVDDEKVVSGSYDKTLKVWDIKTGVCKLTLRGHNAAVLCVQFDDRKIVSGSYDKTIKVWSLAEGSCLMTLTGHHDAVTCLNLTFDSRKVISGSLDHNLKFWDLLNGKCIGTLDWIRSEGHTGVIRCLQTDSWRIVSAGDDKTLKMWSLESGQRLLTLRCHTDGVTCLQFNDYSIVSGSYDKTVKLWDFTPSHEFLTPG